MSKVSTSHDHGRPLNRQDYKTLSLAALGGALEFYDFIIFVFFAVVIGELFFPADIPEWLRQFQTFGIFAAGYLARPLGGIIMAHFGDLIGRKRMFTLSIILMALPTLLIGLLPTYAVLGIAAPLLLLLLRILQGAAIGGEVPGAWVFVAEHVPARRVGVACGTLTAGLTAGILLGSLVATAINRGMSPGDVSDWGWRLAFVLGGVFGIVAMYLRRWLHETPVFAEMQQRKAVRARVHRFDATGEIKAGPDSLASVTTSPTATPCRSAVCASRVTPRASSAAGRAPAVTVRPARAGSRGRGITAAPNSASAARAVAHAIRRAYASSTPSRRASGPGSAEVPARSETSSDPPGRTTRSAPA